MIRSYSASYTYIYFQRVLKVDVDAAVVHAAGVAGKIGAAGLHHHRIHLHKVDALHAVVARQLPHDAAVPRADDQHVPDAGVDRHGHVGDHLIVDELVPLGEHHVPIQRQDPAKLRRLQDVDLLILAPLGVQVPRHPDAVLHVGRVKFAEPQFHVLPPLRPKR